MPTYTETNFEDHIETRLNASGYQSRPPVDYDRVRCLIPDELLQFIQATQPKTFQKLESQYGAETSEKLLDRISRMVERGGVLKVLRNGVTDRGCGFNLTYFRPSSGMNLDHETLYAQNRFTLIRQLKYSERDGKKSLDIALFLNGLPLVTMELKNSLTGQVVADAEKQYREDRDPREPLFRFKRCLVHFAVGNEKVSMTTHLEGPNTRFFPFNQEIENPINPDGHKVAYLWEDILQPDNLMDLINNFIHEQEVTHTDYDHGHGEVREQKRLVLVFPRYHQLDVIRKLKEAVVAEGVGHNYLIQHATGSGKSNSIAWLAHLLTHLYRSPTDAERIFDSIIVVTDRLVLDKQLQETIKQMEQVAGVVHPVDATSAQLREYLESGKDIIISTIQKFSVIAEVIGALKSKTFAVLIDEVHSSQSGESARNLRKSLSKDIQTENADDDEPEVSDMDARIIAEIERRRAQEHISYFGFSGTPKNKTLELFGRKDADGKFVPFHIYSMRQSISEGFTLDVLQNYTTFKRYFQLVKSVPEDKTYEKRRTLRMLTNYVDLQPHSIEQKTRIILEHFTDHTEKTIESKGRAMVVTPSRLHCVRYKQEFDKQMKEMGLSYGCLVAFSGTVHDTDDGQDYTENGMNGLPPNASIANSFKDPQYRILIVSNKFQTGFDEPFLQTMYVDKRLDGLQCVQSLSRLNRVAPGKTGTLVLDFVNEPEQIREAFQQYYGETKLEEETDPNRLYDLQTQLADFDLYDEETINQFCLIFYDPEQPAELLQGVLDTVVEKWSALENNETKEKFRSTLQSYIRLYGYISQLITFTDPALEKLYVFGRNLNQKLPKREHPDMREVLESVDLDSFRLEKVHESIQLQLEDQDGEIPGIGSDVATIRDPVQDWLSKIIEALNEAFQTDFTDEDKVDFETIRRKMLAHETLRLVMEGDNTESNKQHKFGEVFKDVLLEFVESKLELYNKLSKPEINEYLKRRLYQDYFEQAQ